MHHDTAFCKDGYHSVSAVLPMLINECSKSVNLLAVFADEDIVWSGRCVTNFASHVLPLATLTFLLDLRKIGSCTCLQSSSVM